ncbi:MAG: multidrug efflux SMR transporter [bacterium]|nr:multidrug efflux SMR transporter [bacterium]
MGWFYVIVAGVLEVGWIISLKATAGFTRLVPVLCYAGFGIGSTLFLSLALKRLPMAPVYIVWMGIGMVGAAAWGVARHGEPLGWLRVVSMLLVLAGVAGLKASATPRAPVPGPSAVAGADEAAAQPPLAPRAGEIGCDLH